MNSSKVIEKLRFLASCNRLVLFVCRDFIRDTAEVVVKAWDDRDAAITARNIAVDFAKKIMLEADEARRERNLMAAALTDLLPPKLPWKENGEGRILIDVRKSDLRSARRLLPEKLLPAEKEAELAWQEHQGELEKAPSWKFHSKEIFLAGFQKGKDCHS